jgi:glycosyltransferase involved in cell wall biosynthesis
MAEKSIVSVIVPTLNAAGLLPTCLNALRKQDYPQELLDIIVADGGSTDATRDLAKKANARVIANPFRVAEAGKRIALTHARGDFVLFVDADNEISSTDFIRLAVEGLNKFPETAGVESYYPVSPKMSSFCKYLTQTLHIGDPVSWAMSVEPLCIRCDNEFEVWTFPANSFAFPLGANGFMFRAKDLQAAAASTDFEDTEIALQIVQTGRPTWLRLKNRGVFHYIVKGPYDFLRKRRRQAYHFLARRAGGRQRTSWTTMNPAMKPWLACLYCGTFIGPVIDMIRFSVSTRDSRWLWHPVACLLSVVGLAWGVATYRFAKRSADAEAALQPSQKI